MYAKFFKKIDATPAIFQTSTLRLLASIHIGTDCTTKNCDLISKLLF